MAIFNIEKHHQHPTKAMARKRERGSENDSNTETTHDDDTENDTDHGDE